MTVRVVFPRSLGDLRSAGNGDRVAEALSRELDRRVTVDILPSYELLSRDILANEADLGWAPPAVCAVVEPAARAIFKVVRGGGTSFRSMLIVRRGSDLSIDTLDSARAAWVDPMSTSGYLLPRSYLRGRGIEPRRTFSEERFVGSAREAVLAVATGDADVAAVWTSDATDEAARDALQDLVGLLSVEIRPIAFTDPCPSDALVLTRRCDGALADALASLILAEEPPPELLAACNARSFARASTAEYRPLRASDHPPGPYG